MLYFVTQHPAFVSVLSLVALPKYIVRAPLHRHQYVKHPPTHPAVGPKHPSPSPTSRHRSFFVVLSQISTAVNFCVKSSKLIQNDPSLASL